MRVRLISCVAVLVLCASSVDAQGVGPDNGVRDTLRYSNPHARTAADWVSTGIVAWSLVAPCLHDRTTRCFVNEGLQVGSAALTAQVAKVFVSRKRPDGSDNKSFFSMHTAIACAASIQSTRWYLCPSVAYLRIAADKHWATDTIAGGFVGTLSTTIQWGGK